MPELPLASCFPAASRINWMARVEAALKSAGFAEKLMWRSADGQQYQPLYGQIAGPRAGRGTVAPWTIFQRTDHPDAAKANAQLLDDLDNGCNGLTLVCNDAASARGFGIATSKLPRVLRDVALHAIALRIEGSGAEALAAHIATQPLDPERLSIAFAAPSANIAVQLSTQGFRGPLMEADGRGWHESGVTPGEELGAVLGEAISHLRALGNLSDERLARAVGVTLAADQDMFATLAKFRTMRLLWARILEACGLPQAELALHAETSWRMQAVKDPHTNILRATAAVFGAGLGGASSICALPFSLAQGLPNGFARRVARNVQNVLIEEANLWRVADPASGSGYVEQLTQDLTATAWNVFQKTERGIWPSGDDKSTTSLPLIGTSAYPLKKEHAAEVEAL